MSSKLISLTTLLALMTSNSLSQSLSSSATFVLYPYITSGNLTGPYTNSAIDRSQPLSTSSGQESGTWTPDCFNRFTFTSYIGTHCYGQDQCGFKRWSLNETYPSTYTSSGLTLDTAQSGFNGMLIAGKDAADENGGRDVGWSNLQSSADCEQKIGTPGFRTSSEGEKEILHLVYENSEDEEDVFGTFYTCWIDGDIYGPRLFYRNADGTTPDGCAELFLVPRCTADESLLQSPVTSQCYQDGLPA